MNIRRILGDFSVAILAQGISVVLSIATTLILPKVLGVAEFGYWQLFILYSGYVGLFNLGLNDGIYLLKGGMRREDISKKEITGEFLVGIAYQALFSLALLAIAIMGPFDEKREFVIACTAALIIVNNAGLFLGYIFQAINETKVFSFSIAIEGGALLLLVAALLLLDVRSFEQYVICYIASKAVRLLYCAVKGRWLFTTHGVIPSEAISSSVKAIKIGIKLMFASLIGMLILGIVRFAIDFGWDIETFSIVSFSLSIATFFLVFLYQASMVLFPHLRQASPEEQQGFFRELSDALGLFLPGLYLFYPLIGFLLDLWLPAYTDSIRLFVFLFPLCVFDGKMDIIGATYFKVLRKENALLLVNCATLLGSMLFTLLGTLVFHSIEFILASTVLCLGIRCLVSERLLSSYLRCKQSSLSWSPLVISCVFMVTFTLLDEATAELVYTVFFICFLLVYRKQIKNRVSNKLKR